MRTLITKHLNKVLKNIGVKMIPIEPDFEWNGKRLFFPLKVDYRKRCIIDKHGTVLDIELKKDEDLRLICLVFNLAGH